MSLQSAIPIRAPGGFVPIQALAFGDLEEPSRFVTASDPLPTATLTVAATSTPLAGTAAASQVAGPFVPQLGRAIWLTLSGSWSGSVQVQRSRDGGATRQPLTAGGQPWASFTANANEAIGEERVAGATYYLAITLASGSVSYRVEQ